MKKIEIIGKKFGRVTVLEQVDRKEKHDTMYRCRCDCGAEFIARGFSLRHGTTRSCGCLRSELAAARQKARWHKEGENQ